MHEIEEREYIDVVAHARRLGMANFADVTILPAQLESATGVDDLNHTRWTEEVVEALRKEGINATALNTPDEKVQPAIHKGLTWHLPILFFTASYLIDNPNIVSLALGVLANYFTDQLKRIGAGEKNVRVGVAIQTKTASHISFYEGSVDGLKELDKILRRHFPKAD